MPEQYGKKTSAIMLGAAKSLPIEFIARPDENNVVRFEYQEKSMNITKDAVVSFHYTMADEAGNLLETSAADEPTVFLMGRGGMMQGIEDALEGKSAGDEIDVTLSPEQAYGMPRPDAQMRIPRKHLLNKGKLSVGQIVHVNTENGARQATVVKVGLKTVDIDSNHPLAGKTLTFKLNVVDVRESTAEERSHGHAHSASGCSH